MSHNYTQLTKTSVFAFKKSTFASLLQFSRAAFKLGGVSVFIQLWKPDASFVYDVPVTYSLPHYILDSTNFEGVSDQKTSLDQ